MTTPNLQLVQNQPLQPPSKPGEWTLAQIQAALSRPLPSNYLKTKIQGGQRIPFLPWYRVNEILDKYAPGWMWEIVNVMTSEDRFFLTGRLTIPTAEGLVYREATGTEELKLVNSKTGEIEELAYGDPSSNAESKAFRRAAARFGLALYLYVKPVNFH
ncbi:MAG: Rad52/Rad22 family DNA repair protein [Cyanobacteria bacterium P01_H01_bin.15]